MFKQARKEVERSADAGLASGLDTNSIFLLFPFGKKIIDLPGGQINDPLVWGNIFFSLRFLLATASSPSLERLF